MPVYLCIGPLDNIEKGEIWTIKDHQLFPVDLDKLSALSADGPELELIVKHVHNLPHTDHWLQVWFGDMARFIWRAIPGIPGMLSESPKVRPALEQPHRPERQPQEQIEALFAEVRPMFVGQVEPYLKTPADLDRGEAILRLKDAGLKIKEIVEGLGIEYQRIRNYLQLTLLPPDLKEKVRKGRMTPLTALKKMMPK